MTTAEPVTVSRAAEFRSRLQSKIVIADGAMGTILYGKGVFINRCFDELNLSAPQMVKQVHQEYVKSGAEIVETNTFGANRIRLTAFGFAEKAEGHQRGRRQTCSGSSGRKGVCGWRYRSLGAQIEPIGPLSFSEARQMFREQAEALVSAGVDLLVLETFYELSELREAIAASREAAGPEMVIVAQVTVNDDGTLRDGSSTETFTAAWTAGPVDVIGVNCSAGPKVALETIERWRRTPPSRSVRCRMPGCLQPSRAGTSISARRSTWPSMPGVFCWLAYE